MKNLGRIEFCPKKSLLIYDIEIFIKIMNFTKRNKYLQVTMSK